jgi:gamma-glutamyl:cysteine ligase YbdK (ATP-grasp superfamily)
VTAGDAASDDDSDTAADGTTVSDGGQAATGGTAVAGDAADPRLARLPEAVFEESTANKELGLHNVEINTEPTLLGDAGLAAQAAEIRERTAAVRAAAADHDRGIVLDAMWTLPPSEGAADYLSATTDHDDIVFADNMRQYPRYVAIDNDAIRHAGGEIGFSVPGVEATFPSILFESLATSIQPHLQIPSADDFPDYYNTAIRTLGPVLALSTNSPFLPAEFYDVADPTAVIDETPHELRIEVFEQSVNQTDHAKVRVPRDIDATTDVVDRVVADDPYAPFLREWVADDDRDTLADRLWEFGHKRGTYWRWLRCVVGGDHIDDDNDTHSLRIEYRPIPTQPTVTDIVGIQALVAGAIRGLVAADHPLSTLPWDAAEEIFYNAAVDGIDAKLAWVTADGERTTDSDAIFDELFEYARHGLGISGVSSDAIDDYLDPIEARVSAGATPSAWKKQQVRDRLADGDDLTAAIEGMQREYIQRSREDDAFVDWL